MPFLFPLMIKGDYGQAYLTIPIYLVAVLCNIVVGYLAILSLSSEYNNDLNFSHRIVRK